MNKFLKSRTAIMLFAVLLTTIIFILSLFVGSASLPFGEVIGGLFSLNGSGVGSVIMKNIRLPRALGAFLSGLALALSGFLLQRATDNDLCAPNVIGINSGAGFGVMLVSSLFPSLFFMESVFAFFGAILASSFVLLLASFSRSLSRTTVVLGGVAVGALFNSFISLLALAYPDALVSYTAFSVGGLSGVYFDDILVPSIVILLCFIASLLLSPRLNYLALGDELAASVGIRAGTLRVLCIVIASALSASAVSFIGLIGFVGLIVPHLGRRTGISDARFLVPLTSLLGASLVMLADIFARVIFAPGEVPCGIFTSLLGAPFFIYLLVRRSRRSEI